MIGTPQRRGHRSLDDAPDSGCRQAFELAKRTFKPRLVIMESRLFALALDAGSRDEFAADEIDQTDAPSLRAVGSSIRPVGREVAEIELRNVVIVTQGRWLAVGSSMENLGNCFAYTKSKRHARRANKGRPSYGSFAHGRYRFSKIRYGSFR